MTTPITVSELIAWLQTQDQGAFVEILVGDNSGYTPTFYRSFFNPETSVDYTDFRGNQFVRENDPWRDTRTLFLGEEQ